MADRPKLLQVSMHGEVIAHLREKRRSKQIELTYTDLARERWPARTPVVSCSLPVMGAGQDATAFLNGLLPEGQTRAALAAQRDLVASDTWGLLAAYGRDIAGALVISDPDDDRASRPPHAVAYASEDELAVRHLGPAGPAARRARRQRAVPGRDAGQAAAGRNRQPDRLGQARRRPAVHPHPQAGSARPSRGRGPRGRSAADRPRAGLTTIDPQLFDIGGRPCLLVDRYDRILDGATVRRIHQEDLLQAVGLDPADRHGRVKYQEHGGPGYRDAATILLERATDPDAQLDALVGAMVFTVLIGNADAHAKNLSLLLDPPGTVRLAPLYDTVPTMLFPKLKVRCAMWVGGVYRSLEDVTRAELVREIAGRHAWKIPEGDAPEPRRSLGSQDRSTRRRHPHRPLRREPGHEAARDR
jgi:serine/threonine-protein kinase HipA